MYNLQYLLLLCLLSVTRAQVPPELEAIRAIFTTSKPLSGNQNPVQPIGEANITDVPCQCLPIYLCDQNSVAVHADNASVTGSNVINLRFSECQGSIEVCCKKPKKEVKPEVSLPSIPKGCGYRNTKPVDFAVIGGSGKESQFGEFPWVVAIMVIQDSKIFNYGVGALIHPQVVLTAAHIIANYSGNPKNIVARAGEWDARTELEKYKHQDRLGKEVYLHKDYLRSNLHNDVALLLLEQPMQLDVHINVICMPDQDEDFSQYKGCIANGWGTNTFGSNNFAVIQKRVEIDMVDKARCQRLLRRTRLGRQYQLHPSFVCAGGEEGKDTCEGDGGAALACPIGNDRYKVSGLVAGGVDCGKKDVPAIYANVAMFRKWVDDKMAAWGLDISGYRV